MSKTLVAAEVHRNNADWNVFNARRTLVHLVELYDSGQWKGLYQEQTFADAVRQAKSALEHWTDVANNG